MTKAEALKDSDKFTIHFVVAKHLGIEGAMS